MKTLILSILLLASTVLSEERRFGWIGDSGNKRVMMMAPQQWPITTPATNSDLRKECAPVVNQGNLGSCVGNATASAWSFALHRQGEDHLQLSRLLIYYEARRAINSIPVDSGCQIVDAVNWLQRGGSCEERLWPYKTWNFAKLAPAKAYQDGLKRRLVQARKIDNTDGKSLRLALTNGYPVVVGSLVYGGIMDLTSRNYTLPMPKRGERPIGGHAYLIVGHDDRRQLYRAQNSWNTTWGDRGTFLVPYAYIHSGRITEDCWCLIAVMAD